MGRVGSSPFFHPNLMPDLVVKAVSHLRQVKKYFCIYSIYNDGEIFLFAFVQNNKPINAIL